MSEGRREPVTGRKAIGRPRNVETSSPVSTWVAAGVHDRLIQAAKGEGLSVSGYIRRVLVLTLKK